MSPASLVEVIHWLEGAFDRTGGRRSYGGAIAYNYYGPPRLTQDVDVLASVPNVRVPALVEELAAAGCLHGDVRPRPPELRAILDDLRGKAHMTIFLYGGVRVEMFVPWHPFQHRVLDRSPERELEGRRIRIHTAEDLIVFKKIFDRPKDITDIKAMLLAQQGKLDLARIRAEAREMLSDESLRELEEMVASYPKK